MKKKHALVLQNIMNSIPKEFKDKLMKEEWLTPSWKKDIEDFLAGKGKNKLLKERFTGKEEELQHLYDAGVFSKTEMVTDPKIEKKINDYLDGEIKKAVEAGLLPKNTGKIKSKLKQYARRKTKNNS